MPELPEVETIRLGLADLLPGKEIAKFSLFWPKSLHFSPEEAIKLLKGSVVTSVDRRAKVLFISLSNGYSLVIHLKMTGQLVYRSKEFNFAAGHPTKSLVGSLPDNSTRIEISFKDGSKLFFNDQRKFGWMKLIKSQELNNDLFFKNYGPEPLDPDITSQILKKQLLRSPNRSIKAVLLDQSILAGLGNIYVDESLWLSKIHPLTKPSLLSDDQFKKLARSIVEVLKLSISKGGSTNRNYVNANGEVGKYIDFAKVYKKEGLPCSRCGTKIIKIRVAGRGTHICPKCQILLVE